MSPRRRRIAWALAALALLLFALPASASDNSTNGTDPVLPDPPDPDGACAPSSDAQGLSFDDDFSSADRSQADWCVVTSPAGGVAFNLGGNGRMVLSATGRGGPNAVARPGDGVFPAVAASQNPLLRARFAGGNINDVDNYIGFINTSFFTSLSFARMEYAFIAFRTMWGGARAFTYDGTASDVSEAIPSSPGDVWTVKIDGLGTHYLRNGAEVHSTPVKPAGPLYSFALKNNGGDTFSTDFQLDDWHVEAGPAAVLRSVSGAVRDPAGNPVAGATVTVNTTLAQTNATDGQGRFEFKVAPGVYAVSVVDQGFTVDSKVADARAADATVDFTVSRVSGTVFSIDGPPIPGAAVLFDTRTVFAGTGGVYSALVLPGLHNLSGCAPGFECQGKHADATKNNSSVDFFLLPSGRITHRVAYIPIEFGDFAPLSPSNVEFLETGADLVSRYFWNQSIRQAGVAYEFVPKWTLLGKNRTDFNLADPKCPVPFFKRDIVDLTDQAAKSAGIDPSRFQGIAAVFPDGALDGRFFACPNTGRAWVGELNPYGVWAHELTHALFGLGDYYPAANRSLGDLHQWDLMGGSGWTANPTSFPGPWLNPPSSISTRLKVLAGWLKSQELQSFRIGDVPIRNITEYLPQERVPFASYPYPAPWVISLGDSQAYWFEGRQPPDGVGKDGRRGGLLGERAAGPLRSFLPPSASGVMMYLANVTFFGLGESLTALPNQDELSNGRENYGNVTLTVNGVPYYDFLNGVTFSAKSREGRIVVEASPIQRSLLRILLVRPSALLQGAPFLSPPPINATLEADLHAFTLDGRHLGKNYTTGLFEFQIPGGHLNPTSAGIETISLPSDTFVLYTIDPTPARRWLDEYNRFATENDLPLLAPENVAFNVIFAGASFDAGGNRSDSTPFTVTINATGGAPIALPARVDIDPDSLNMRSRGEFVTAYVELPEGFDPGSIDIRMVRLFAPGGDVPAVSDPRFGFVKNPEVEDRDGNGIPELMVKFDRAEVIARVSSGTTPLVLRGFTAAGLPFEGRDVIRISQ